MRDGRQVSPAARAATGGNFRLAELRALGAGFHIIIIIISVTITVVTITSIIVIISISIFTIVPVLDLFVHPGFPHVGFLQHISA